MSTIKPSQVHLMGRVFVIRAAVFANVSSSGVVSRANRFLACKRAIGETDALICSGAAGAETRRG